MGLVFNGMETFFLRAEALGAEQRIGADASVLARDKAVGTAGMECPDKGRKGGKDGSNGANGWKWAEMAATRMPLGCTEGVDWGLKGVDG